MREQWQENELRDAMGKVSRRNRVTLSRYIKLKRANGWKVGTLVNYVDWLRKLEGHAEGEAFNALTAGGTDGTTRTGGRTATLGARTPWQGTYRRRVWFEMSTGSPL